MGLANTNFMNVTGLPQPEHYSTARDLATLAAAVIRDFPEYYPLYSLKEFRYNNITQPKSQPAALGRPVRRRHEDRPHRSRRLVPRRLGKARRAPAARGRSGRIVGLGARDRGAEAPQLWLSGVRHRPALPFGQDRSSRFASGKARRATVGAGFFADQYLTLPKGKATALQLTMTASEPLVAPIARGQQVGTVKVALEGQHTRRVPAGRARPTSRPRVFSDAHGIPSGCGSS